MLNYETRGKQPRWGIAERRTRSIWHREAEAGLSLAESEQRLRLATEAAGIGTFTIELQTGRASYSPELIAMLGLPSHLQRQHRGRLPAGASGTTRLASWTKYKPALKEADGGQMKMDFRFVIPGGEIRWMTWTSRVEFRNGPSGRVPFRVAGACVDITERKRAEEALRESEERFRGIFDHAAIGIAIADLEGRFQACNPAYCRMLGYTQEELRELNFSGLVHPDDREAGIVNRSRLIQQWISSFEALTRYKGKDGRLIWVQRHVSLLTNAAGQPDRILALVTDVTGRRHQEEKIRLLASEVNHRSKNMLTLVQAIARQTFVTGPGDFISRFGERIEALAASQDLLVKNGWKGAHFDELVRSQLAHFADLIGSRIELEGPPLLITASAAQTIGMALHELATNAGKYGALSGTTGGIRIEWRGAGTGAAGDARFELSWAERGGPPVAPPARTGFGTVVIEDIPRAELNAEVALTYAPEGVPLARQLPCQLRFGAPRHEPARRNVKLRHPVRGSRHEMPPRGHGIVNSAGGAQSPGDTPGVSGMTLCLILPRKSPWDASRWLFRQVLSATGPRKTAPARSPLSMSLR